MCQAKSFTCIISILIGPQALKTWSRIELSLEDFPCNPIQKGPEPSI